MARSKKPVTVRTVKRRAKRKHGVLKTTWLADDETFLSLKIDTKPGVYWGAVARLAFSTAGPRGFEYVLPAPQTETHRQSNLRDLDAFHSYVTELRDWYRSTPLAK